jgi:hypothetical protein
VPKNWQNNYIDLKTGVTNSRGIKTNNKRKYIFNLCFIYGSFCICAKETDIITEENYDSS